MASRREFIRDLGIFATLFPLAGCEDFLPELTKFTIRQGEHYYEGPDLRFTTKSNLHYEVLFPESQIHPPREDCPSGWSKIFGISRTATEHHHENSARFGYRCDDFKLFVGHYTYVNGERTAGYISEIEPEQFYDFKIQDTGKEWNYYFEGNLVHSVAHPESEDVKRVLYPYHGGHCGAWQDTYLIFKK